MASVKYDPVVIQTFADALYRRANSIILWTTVLYAVGGAALGAFLGGAQGAPGLFAVIGAVVLGVLGYQVGSMRAFMLKLQAQTALCQMQTELNTRLIAHQPRAVVAAPSPRAVQQ